MAPSIFTNLLHVPKHYLLIRWKCCAHGWFETGTLIFMHTANCPECGQPALYIEHCDGMTMRSLPFTSRPRVDAEPDAAITWQVTNNTGVTTRPKANKDSVRRGGRRSTGRPKKRPEVKP